MPLAALSDLKAHLDLPQDDTSADERLKVVLAAVEHWALEQTGFSLTDIDGFIETRENVKLGLSFYLRRRNVKEIKTAEGRLYGQDDWSAIRADLIDKESGRCMLLPTGGLLSQSVFGQSELNPLRYRPRADLRWREIRFPVVRITYNVERLQPVPADLRHAVIAIASAMVTTTAAGNVKSVSVGDISESYGDLGIPPWAYGYIIPYMREMCSMVV